MSATRSYYTQWRNFSLWLTGAGVVVLVAGAALWLWLNDPEVMVVAAIPGFTFALMGAGMAGMFQYLHRKWQKQTAEAPVRLEWAVPRTLLLQDQLAHTQRNMAFFKHPVVWLVVAGFVVVKLAIKEGLDILEPEAWTGDEWVMIGALVLFALGLILGILWLRMVYLRRKLATADSEPKLIRLYDFGMDYDGKPFLWDGLGSVELRSTEYHAEGVAEGYGRVELNFAKGDFSVPVPHTLAEAVQAYFAQRK